MRKRKRIRGVVALILAIVIIIAGAVGGLYVGAWLMIIKPIMCCCAAFDAKALTAVMVGKTVLSCIFAGFVGWLLFYIGLIVGRLLLEVD